MILWRTYDKEGKNTGLLLSLYVYGDVHVMARPCLIVLSKNGYKPDCSNKKRYKRSLTYASGSKIVLYIL